MSSFFNRVIAITKKRQAEQQEFELRYNLETVQELIVEAAQKGYNTIHVETRYLTDNVVKWLEKEGFILTYRTYKAGENGREKDVVINAITWLK